MKRVFIVGCPRSGSTWSTFLLAQHPAIATFQHAKIFDYLIQMEHWYRRKAGYSFIVEPAGRNESGAASSAEKNRRLANVLSEERLYNLLGGVAGGILDEVAGAREGASIVVDKTPENGHLADFILKVLPDAYFLHIVRDPRSVFSSHRNASKSWARWEFPTRSVDGGRFWRKDVETSLAIASKTERYLQVRYEDLKSAGPTELARIFEWLDVAVTPEFCAQALAASTKDKVRDTQELPQGFVRKAAAGGWRDELSTGDVKVIEYLAGDLMESLGYERSLPRSSKPLRVWMRDLPEPALAFLDTRLHRLTQLMHWGWVGRKLEWNDP